MEDRARPRASLDQNLWLTAAQGTRVACRNYLEMRYKVRRGQKGWLVWDTETNAVAIVDHSFAIDLSAETANLFARSLNMLEPSEIPPKVPDEKN